MENKITILLVGICLFFYVKGFSQYPGWARDGGPYKNGRLIGINQQQYQHEVIDSWRYDYISNVKLTYSDKGIGKVIFWRSEPFTDKKTGRKWKPSIAFDVFLLSDMPDLKVLSDSVKQHANCDSINMGGEFFSFGHFILFNSTECSDCASPSKIDYCRQFVLRFLSSIANKESMKFEKLLNQMEIKWQKFQP